MNNEVKAYLAELRDKQGQDSNMLVHLGKAIKPVREARSPIDPTVIDHLKHVDDYISKRVTGHFSQANHKLVSRSRRTTALRGPSLKR